MAPPNPAPHVHGTTDEIRSARQGGSKRLRTALPRANNAKAPLTGNYGHMFKLKPASFGGAQRANKEPDAVQQLLAGLAGTMFKAQPVEASAPKALAAGGAALAPAGLGVAALQSGGCAAMTSGGTSAAGPASVAQRAESAIPAGYTYLGQFIDHDVTFDPISNLRRTERAKKLVDLRTPALDLDSLYGRGPVDEPYLYLDGIQMILGDVLGPIPDAGPDSTTPRDLPRNPDGRAIIGDPRNDENVIISQLHGIFLFFHNRLARDLVLPSRK